MSENYFQHADHFTRILNEQESYKKSKFSQNSIDTKKDQEPENIEKKNETAEEETKNKPVDVETKTALSK